MNPDPRAYKMNYDWIWSKQNRKLQKTASLRVTVAHPDRGAARRLCDHWLAGIEHSAGDSVHYWVGGWAVVVESRSAEAVVMVLSSGGQDSSDSLQDAADRLFDSVIAPDPLVTVNWEELPLTR